MNEIYMHENKEDKYFDIKADQLAEEIYTYHPAVDLDYDKIKDILDKKEYIIETEKNSETDILSYNIIFTDFIKITGELDFNHRLKTINLQYNLTGESTDDDIYLYVYILKSLFYIIASWTDINDSLLALGLAQLSEIHQELIICELENEEIIEIKKEFIVDENINLYMVIFCDSNNMSVSFFFK
jgi:hypothetical protein